GLQWRIRARRPVPLGPHHGVYLRGDETVQLAGWPAVELRVVSYQLPDYRWVWVLTDRFDLTAASVAQLYKERWKIETWWKWIKAMLKIKRPLGESATALPLQLIAAFVTDLLWRGLQTLRPLSACPLLVLSWLHGISLVLSLR